MIAQVVLLYECLCDKPFILLCINHILLYFISQPSPSDVDL